MVFDGLDKERLKRVVFLDSNKKRADKILQKNIEQLVEKEKYEWLTLRINSNGKVVEE